jgi:hypothetical protein
MLAHTILSNKPIDLVTRPRLIRLAPLSRDCFCLATEDCAADRFVTAIFKSQISPKIDTQNQLTKN